MGGGNERDLGSIDGFWACYGECEFFGSDGSFVVRFVRGYGLDGEHGILFFARAAHFLKDMFYSTVKLSSRGRRSQHR